MGKLTEGDRQELGRGLQRQDADRSHGIARESSKRIFRDRVRPLLVLAVLLLIVAGLLCPTRHPPLKKWGRMEAIENLADVSACQERYFLEHGTYLACPANPIGWTPGTGATTPIGWDEGIKQWEAIGFEPLGNVRYQYAVTVSGNGESFVATATGDLDEDGEVCIFTVAIGTENYPKPVKHGDDY